MLLTKGEDGQAFIYRESCYRHDENSERVVYLDNMTRSRFLYFKCRRVQLGVYCCQNCGRHFGQMGRLKRHITYDSRCVCKFPDESDSRREDFLIRRLSIFEEICMLPIEEYRPDSRNVFFQTDLDFIDDRSDDLLL